MKLPVLTMEQADKACRLIFRHLKRDYTFNNKGKTQRNFKWYVRLDATTEKLRRALEKAGIIHNFQPKQDHWNKPYIKIYVPTNYYAPEFNEKPRKEHKVLHPKSISIPKGARIIDRTKTALPQSNWQTVTTDTDRMRLPQGNLFRTIVYGYAESSPPAVAMVFVPD